MTPSEAFKAELEALLKKFPTVTLQVQHNIHIQETVEAVTEPKEETKTK